MAHGARYEGERQNSYLTFNYAVRTRNKNIYWSFYSKGIDFHFICIQSVIDFFVFILNRYVFFPMSKSLSFLYLCPISYYKTIFFICTRKFHCLLYIFLSFFTFYTNIFFLYSNVSLTSLRILFFLFLDFVKCMSIPFRSLSAHLNCP